MSIRGTGSRDKRGATPAALSWATHRSPSRVASPLARARSVRPAAEPSPGCHCLRSAWTLSWRPPRIGHTRPSSPAGDLASFPCILAAQPRTAGRPGRALHDDRRIRRHTARPGRLLAPHGGAVRAAARGDAARARADRAARRGARGARAAAQGGRRGRRGSRPPRRPPRRVGALGRAALRHPVRPRGPSRHGPRGPQHLLRPRLGLHVLLGPPHGVAAARRAARRSRHGAPRRRPPQLRLRHVAVHAQRRDAGSHGPPPDGGHARQHAPSPSST